MRSASCLLVALALLACAAPPAPPAYDVSLVEQRVVPRGDVRNHLVRAGLSIVAETGEIEIAYASGFELTLIRVDENRPFWSEVAWRGSAGVDTDGIVALGGDRYAIVAPDGGYLFDASLGGSRSFFCYLPGQAEGEWPAELEQRSRALAYDPRNDRLYAQPRTTRGRELVRNEIAQFDARTGEDLAWWPIDAELDADALAVLADGRLVLATRDALHAFDPTTGLYARIADLDALGLGPIVAMTWHEARGQLLLLEASSARVVWASFNTAEDAQGERIRT